MHLVVAGPIDAFRGHASSTRSFHLRPGRELPRPPGWGVVDGALQAVAEGLPPWWGLPAPTASQQLFLWFFAVMIIAVAVPAGRRSCTSPRQRRAARPFVLLAAGLFGLGILPQALQRPDSTHLAWVAVVSWSLLGVTDRSSCCCAASPERQRLAQRRRRRRASALLMLVVCPFYTYRHYLLQTRVSVGEPARAVPRRT